jgi:hypothetical protein
MVIGYEAFVVTELEQKGFDQIRLTVSPDVIHEGMGIVYVTALYHGNKVSMSYPRPIDEEVTEEEAEFVSYYLATSVLN